jgi:phytoene dehydrogenase-like protein
MSQLDAVVVGSGPNGLVAALALARAGRTVAVLEAASTPGGGTRTAELTLPGFHNDVCSSAHPLLAISPAFRELNLAARGVELIHPDIAAAHPLDDGSAALLCKSVADTARSLGADADRYRNWANTLTRHGQSLVASIFAPLVRVPRHPVVLATFGLRNGLRSAYALADRFQTEQARALIAGLGAHSIQALDRRATGGVAATMALTAHIGGWPFIRGGSGRVSDVLVEMLGEHGVEVRCDHRVRTLGDIPASKVVLWDTDVRQLASIAEDDLPRRYTKRLNRYRFAPGVFKVDYALSAPIPWTAEGCRKAGSVHVGGNLEAVATSEAAAVDGRNAPHPFLIVTQPTVVDGSRAPGGQHVAWAYCHVPNGSDRDFTAEVESQLERFAPGFRDVVLARHTTTAADLEAYNPNNVGGDIGNGAITLWQTLFRPTFGVSPYRTPNPRHYVCSAATPPGAGVHGMCGWNAAHAALRHTLK